MLANQNTQQTWLAKPCVRVATGLAQEGAVPALMRRIGHSRDQGFPVTFAGCRIGPKYDLRVGSRAISFPLLTCTY